MRKSLQKITNAARASDTSEHMRPKRRKSIPMAEFMDWEFTTDEHLLGPVVTSGSTGMITPPPEVRYRTGQGWLKAGVRLLDEYVFSKAGYATPQVFPTIGFPSRNATSRVRRYLGQCWVSSISDAGVNYICISPLIKTDVERLDILAHEMVHAVDDCKSGHRGNFIKICKAVGLTKGKPSSASAGAALMHIIEQICLELGPCPLVPLNYTPRVRKATARTHKLECPQCQFTCRTSEKDAQEGLPTCACGTKLVDLSVNFPMLA